MIDGSVEACSRLLSDGERRGEKWSGVEERPVADVNVLLEQTGKSV